MNPEARIIIPKLDKWLYTKIFGADRFPHERIQLFVKIYCKSNYNHVRAAINLFDQSRPFLLEEVVNKDEIARISQKNHKAYHKLFLNLTHPEAIAFMIIRYERQSSPDCLYKAIKISKTA